MEKSNAIAALAALSQDSRLDVFRLLQAGLVTVKREGRSLIYAARFETMNALLGYLTENCCAGVADCASGGRKPAPTSRKKKAKVAA
jgi:hypothetical protein